MEGVTSKQEKIPLDVLAIAGKMKMTPIAWNIHPSFIVIVFEQGPKMIFEREVDPVEAIHSIPAHLRDESPVHSSISDPVTRHPSSFISQPGLPSPVVKRKRATSSLKGKRS